MGEGRKMMKKNYIKPNISRITFNYTVVAAASEDRPGEIETGPDDPAPPVGPLFFSRSNAVDYDEWSYEDGELENDLN